MQWCPFGPHLASYAGDPIRLAAHVERCDTCRVVARLLVAASTTSSDAPTPDCPDEVMLAAYSQGLLQPDELQRVGDHVGQCMHCIELLRADGEQATADAELALDRAERRLDAAVLSREIADWLVREHYPEEGAAVRELLKASGRSRTERAEEKELEVVPGFSFAGAGRSRAVQIAELVRFLARLIEQLPGQSGIADRFSKHMPELRRMGAQEVLLALIEKRLRDA